MRNLADVRPVFIFICDLKVWYLHTFVLDWWYLHTCVLGLVVINRAMDVAAAIIDCSIRLLTMLEDRRSPPHNRFCSCDCS